MAARNGSVTILNTASLSSEFVIGRGSGVGLVIEMPAAWTAASLTFQGSIDGINFVNVYDDTNTEVSVATSTSRAHTSVPTSVLARLLNFHSIKIRSGTAGAAVAQGADRVIGIRVVERVG